MVGIFFGMQATEWNETRSNGRLELEHLKDLRVDFISNQKNFTWIRGKDQDGLTAMISLVEQSLKPSPDLSAEQLNDLFRELQYMSKYSDTKRAYSSLTGSGDLKLISSKELKDGLANYYSRLQTLDIVHNTHEMQLVETFQPYIIREMEYQQVALNRSKDYPLPTPTKADAILNVLNTREFRNVVIQKWVVLSDLLAQHTIVSTQNDVVIQLLDKAIAKSKGIEG